MTLMETLLEIVKEPVRFHKGGYANLLNVNMLDRTIKNGKIVIVKNGKIVPQTIKLSDQREFVITEDMVLVNEDYEEVYNHIEKLYAEFKSSVPTDQERFSINNFKAKCFEELSLEEMINGINRDVARIHLECFILFSAMKEAIPWLNNKHWYWQSPRDKELLIYKNWV